MMANNNHTTTVVIAGAGPTGLSMAAQLIRYKIDFILLEKKESITTLSKAVVVQARSLEIFQELGIADEAIRRGRETTGMHLYYKGKQKLGIDLAGLGNGLSQFTFALSLEQSKTEQLLLDYLTANGKKVQWKTEFTRFEQHPDGVTVYYNDANGAEQKITAAYLVGCDGAGSLVRHQLNLSFGGSTEPKLFYVADVIITSPVINENVLYMYMIKKGFVLFFPMEGEGHYRVVGVLPDHDDNHPDYEFSEIEPIIRKNIITPLTFDKLKWFSTYKVHSRKASSFMQGRCFIAGDAGHIHTPAGGQGMNTGIQDAYNLAWKMAATIRGEVKEEVLKTYDTERTENARHLLKTTDRVFDIMSGVNRFWNFVRLIFLPILFWLISKSKFIKRKIFPLLSQTNIAYPKSYLTAKSTIRKVKAGDRMHYFELADGRNIFSYLNEPVFKLLYFGKEAVKNPFETAKIQLRFHCFTEIPKKLFGNATAFYILLRPDNHISYIGKDIDQCRELIDKISVD